MLLYLIDDHVKSCMIGESQLIGLFKLGQLNTSWGVGECAEVIGQGQSSNCTISLSLLLLPNQIGLQY